ncbi:MAG TPA: acyltransferase [Nocardioidaceae bacterium]|nr:acyltransferase [Nocardioidaceae bacterium]
MGILATARTLAERTPPQRNRYVDLLRAVSILVVVLGHWTMAAVTVRDGELVAGHVLVLAAWTHPFTWVFQVMPVFFLVGGYANAMSWRSAQRRDETYGTWLRARVRRLTLPVVPVLLVWFAAGGVALAAGVGWRTLRLASAVALVPTWFLAAYVLVVAVAPVTLLAWERWRWWSFAAGAAASGLVDVVSLSTGSLAVGFLNYLLVWATVHQLGYAWRDGALDGLPRRAGLLVVGLAGVVLLVVLGPYPVSMVGVDTATVNNTYPTRVTLLLLGMFQAGVVLLVEPAGRRLVDGARAWSVVVALNARIMTLYLWHVTAMVGVIGIALLAGGRGLVVEPLTAGWWLTRPLWYVVLGTVTVGLVALLGRFETPDVDPRPAPPSWRPLAAVVGVCAGLGALAVLGIADADGLHWWLLVVPLAALGLGGVVGPPARLRRR